MQARILLLSVVAVVLVAARQASAEEDAALTRARILTTLMTHAREPLKAHRSCESFSGLQGTKSTVGSFIAWSLAFMERGVDNAVTVQCAPWQEGAPWRRGRAQCDVSFNADSKGESPWSCGLRFEHDEAKQSIDPKTLQCIGTC